MNRLFNLPTDTLRLIYEYDSTYKDLLNNILKTELNEKVFGTYTHMIYEKCVKCGTDKKDPDYHWCFKCFSEWEAQQRVEKKSNDYLFSD